MMSKKRSGNFKHKVRKKYLQIVNTYGNKPLAQIANRLTEIQKAQYDGQNYVKSYTYPQLKYVTSNSHLSGVIKDNSTPIYQILAFDK